MFGQKHTVKGIVRTSYGRCEIAIPGKLFDGNKFLNPARPTRFESSADNGYDVYRYTSNSDGGVQVISLLSTAVQKSGSIDLKEILDWIVGKGWIDSSATINQIGYGVEICSTEDRPATFSFTDFSVTMD